MIYPKLLAGERELPRAEKDILYAPRRGFFPYTVHGRYRHGLVDILARKYGADIENYPSGQTEDLLLLGEEVCQRRLEVDCVAQRKIGDFLKDSPTKPARIYGIYAPRLDDSDENRQQFIILGQNRLYLRDQSLGMRSWSLAELEFHEDGIGLKGEEERLLEWFLEPRFAQFATELLLLLQPPAQEIQLRHPFQDEMARSGAKEEDYLAILIVAALDGDRLDAQRVLLLEHMAISFQLSQDLFYRLVRDLDLKGTGGNAILTAIVKARNNLGQLPPTVLYLDILQNCVNCPGEVTGKNVVAQLARERFAGRAFVDNYLEYLEYDAKARECLGRCFELEDAQSRQGLLALEGYRGLHKLHLLKK